MVSGRAISLHVALLVVVPGCAVAAWWQINRAQDGNQLSYLYSVMWPAFGILGLTSGGCSSTPTTTPSACGACGAQAMAGRARPPTPGEATSPLPAHHRSGGTASAATEEDPELAAYNARLAELAAKGPRPGAARESVVVRRAPVRRLTERGLEGALFRYQLMANIVGVLIIPLFLFTGLHTRIRRLQSSSSPSSASATATSTSST